MRSVLSIHRSQAVANTLAGVIKATSKDPRKPTNTLRSLDKYFWYTSSDGVTRLVTSSDTLNEIPQQINDYIFDPTVFAHQPHPSALPVWPPKHARDLLYVVGLEGEECVGNTYFNAIRCRDPTCKHIFEQWKTTTENWQDYFELRKTGDRGIGVYTKKAFKKRDIVGWYAGELVSAACSNKSDYLMLMPIGVPSYDSETDTDSDGENSPKESSYTTDVLIDAKKKGNWTRFINHSCEPHAHFQIARVGSTRIMVVQAVKGIPAGVELTVCYGEEYYGVNTNKVCCCGTRNCVSKAQNEEDGEWKMK
jgi:hypothetical protein